MVGIDWSESFRIIFSRFPSVGIFDDVADPADLPAIFELERRTNSRVRDEIGDIALVRPTDRISGPGTTPIMAAFTHARPSRFGDASYGVYYAALKRTTAVSETVYHVERLYRQTAEASADVDMRVYAATITGSFEDLRAAPATDDRLDPDSYAASVAFARPLHDADITDGIAYRSVRDRNRGECVACFRARNVSSCYTHSYLTYRWDGKRQRIIDVHESAALTQPSP